MEIQQETSRLNLEDLESCSDFQYDEKGYNESMASDDVPKVKATEKRIDLENSFKPDIPASEQTCTKTSNNCDTENASQSFENTDIREEKGYEEIKIVSFSQIYSTTARFEFVDTMTHSDETGDEKKPVSNKEEKSQNLDKSNLLDKTRIVDYDGNVTIEKIEKKKKTQIEEGDKFAHTKKTRTYEEDDTISLPLQSGSMTKNVSHKDNTTDIKKTGNVEEQNKTACTDQNILEKTKIAADRYNTKHNTESSDGKEASPISENATHVIEDEKVEKTNPLDGMPQLDSCADQSTISAVVKHSENDSVNLEKNLKAKDKYKTVSKKSRIILIGKTGTGKSATGNTILGDGKFNTASAFVSCTSTPQKESCICYDHLLEVIDTPGLYDTSKTQDMVKQELAHCIEMCSPGPHVFLVIMSVGRVTEEEKNTLKYMTDLFGGQGFLNHTILIITRKEDLNPDIDVDDEDEDFDLSEELVEFIKDSEELTKMVRQCNDRCLAISNSGQVKGQKRRKEAEKIIQLIDQLIDKNDGICYSNEMFKELEKQKEIRRKEEERRKQNIQKELEREEKERNLEKKRRQRRIEELESNVETEKRRLDKLQWDSDDTISDFKNKIEELRAENVKSERETEKELQRLERLLSDLEDENDNLDRDIRNIKYQLSQRDKSNKSTCLLM